MELSRLKQLLGIDEGDTSKDVSLSFVISDVEEIIKNYCHIEEVPDGLLNTVAVAIFSIFGVFTLYQGLRLIHVSVYPIPILPLLIAVTVVFVGLCVWLFTNRVKKSNERRK